MKAEKTSQLYDRNIALEFYEDRYDRGYMDEWPIEKKRKIFEVIRDLQLPASGEALDFGCGNGVFTEVIRQALPNWKVYGTDISKKAIDNAKIRYRDCIFFTADDPDLKQKKFDFVFTHHVFEHVFNVNEAFQDMDKYLKPESSMLHFLPCGNEGSYERNICLMRKDGIDPKLENRFFYEDEGHVRRLNTEQFCQLAKTINFELAKELYSYQHEGSIEWITSCSPKLVLKITDPSQAIDEEARQKLKKLRWYLMPITIARLPGRVVAKILNKKNKNFKDYLFLIGGLPFYPFSSPIDRYWKRKSREEWETRKFDRNGSEMGLYFKRS
jgi:SAM-dependent methyltransferase